MSLRERAVSVLFGLRDRVGHLPLIAINKLLRPIGLALVKRRALELIYRHDYGRQGYERYRSTQIFHNRRKFGLVYADAEALGRIADHIRDHGRASRGICHGARNGWEVRTLKERLGCEVIGTDISETALALPDMVQHDFHEPREDWIGRFSFVYSNALDQAFDPGRALATWADQLAPGGAIYLEHGVAHTPATAGAIDPFGAHPMVMPYLIHEWGRGLYYLDEILRIDAIAHGGKRNVWVFVLRRSPAPAAG